MSGGGLSVYRSPYMSTSANTPADYSNSVHAAAHYSNAMAAAYHQTSQRGAPQKFSAQYE